MQALTFHKTTNKDLSIGLKVLVPSVNGEWNLGYDTNHKKVEIISQTKDGTWLAGDCEYMADEIILIKEEEEICELELLIAKYYDQLENLKQNRRLTVDTNTDDQNHLFDVLIETTANFLRDLKKLA